MLGIHYIYYEENSRNHQGVLVVKFHLEDDLIQWHENFDPMMYRDFKIIKDNLHMFSVSLCQAMSLLETFDFNEG